MMTVSAVARLMPRPPALVLSRKAKSVDPGALKCSIACNSNTAHVSALLQSWLWLHAVAVAACFFDSIVRYNCQGVDQDSQNSGSFYICKNLDGGLPDVSHRQGSSHRAFDAGNPEAACSR